jgi:hypothetical protein
MFTRTQYVRKKIRYKYMKFTDLTQDMVHDCFRSFSELNIWLLYTKESTCATKQSSSVAGKAYGLKQMIEVLHL